MATTSKNKILEKYTTIFEISTVEECNIFFKKVNDEIQRGVFGLDIEHKNSKGGNWQPSILQISSDAATVILKLGEIEKSSFSCGIPPLNHHKDEKEFKKEIKVPPKELKTFLQNPNFIKVGMDILSDVGNIKQYWNNITIVSCIDLRFLLKNCNLQRTNMRALNVLTKYFLGITLSRSPSNWNSEEKLTPSQLSYAAADSFYSLQLFYRFWNSSIYCARRHVGRRRHGVGRRRGPGILTSLLPIVVSESISTTHLENEKDSKFCCIMFINRKNHQNLSPRKLPSKEIYHPGSSSYFI